VIQKLITIPAAMQKVSNPVPRIRHPDWLHRRVAGAVDRFKQNKVTDFFSRVSSEDRAADDIDIEDIGGSDAQSQRPRIAVVNRKFTRRATTPPVSVDDAPLDDVRSINPSVSYYAWLKALEPLRRKRQRQRGDGVSAIIPAMFGNAKVRTNHRWDVVQVRPSKIAGRFTMWLSIDSALVAIPLRISREFYLHLRKPAQDDLFRTEFYSCDKVVRNLPRDLHVNNLYKIAVKEDVYLDIQEHFTDLINDPNVEGVFELQV
jgi:DNA polymerase epsilon subunit 1